MSVALVISNQRDRVASRLVPVATQQVFVARWLPGARVLGLPWIEMMETGFDVTVDDRDAIVDELLRLRAWMVAQWGAGAYEVERLDRLVAELRGLRFDEGVEVFLG